VSAPEPLSLTGVTVRLGGREVLSRLDLDVPAGRSTVLVGRSGSGKSTCLRAIAGLVDPDAGRIEVGGRTVADPRSLVPCEERGVGMVFQTLELFPHMTVAENVAFGLPGRARGRAAEAHPRVREVSAAVGIEGLLSRRPPTLSGGERQRAAIARAIAPSPSALLYDEPLGNLDPDRRAEVRLLVRALRQTRPTTVLYVTHDAEEALEMGDEVAVLEGGRIVDRGPPDRVYRRPSCVASARALGPATLLRARRVSRDGSERLVTALGELAPAPEAPPDADVLCLRPEEVRPGPEGAKAVVIDCVPRGEDWGFTARLAADDVKVQGRSSVRLAVGDAVSLRVVGDPAWLGGGGAPARALAEKGAA
jgi:iron(III) transport system ATP-binding protein